MGTQLPNADQVNERGRDEIVFNVVFVDDEVEILEGLQRRLRSMRHEWHMTFCSSAKEVLELLAREPVDILVSDIRMPVMSGVELMMQVKDNYPRVVRIALSGDAGSETELDCAQAVHQFISKPADAEKIRDAISRSRELQNLLGSRDLQAVIGGVDSLPSLPDLYVRFTNEANKEGGSLANAATVISEDIAMSAKILQLVNSSFFGIPRQIQSIQQAATMLGISTLKALILSEKVFEASATAELGGLKLSAFASRSHKVAGFASALAKAYGLSRVEIDDALMAGCLRNVGQLVLASNFPDRYSKVVAETERGVSCTEAELAEFGVSHSMVGGYLLGLWGLPFDIVDSVLNHSSIERDSQQIPSLRFSVQMAVHLVGALENGLEIKDIREELKEVVPAPQLEIALASYQEIES